MNKTIEAKLRISAVDRTGKVFQSVAGKLDHVNRRAEAVNQRYAAVSRASAGAMAAMARYAAPAALALGGAAAVKAAADFEQALFNIQKKSGATTEQMGKLRGEILQLSREIPVSVDEIAMAFERNAAAGIPLDELKEASKLAASTADAWDSTSEDVSNVFAGFTAGMGVARKDMAALASLINDLADSGIADEKDIADFMDRSGASLNNFGMTPEQIAAYGAAMLNLKMPAEVAARAIESLTGKLAAPENLSPKSHTALKSIVGDMDAFSKMAGSAKLMFFLRQVERMTPQRRTSLIGAMMGEGFDGQVTRLVAGLQEVQRNVDMAKAHIDNPSNSIVATQTKKLELFNSQLVILKNNLSGMVTELTEQNVMPWLSDALKAVNEKLAEIEKQKSVHKGQSWEESQQEREQFFDIYKERHSKNDPFMADQWNTFNDARRLVADGKLRSTDEFWKKEDEQKRIREAKNQYILYGQGRALVNNVPEFPGGGRGYSTKNLPGSDAPIPGVRPSADATRNKALRENLEQYGDAYKTPPSSDLRSVARNPDLAQTVARLDALDKSVGSTLWLAGEKAGKSVEDGGQKGGDHLSAAGQDFLDSIMQGVQALRSAGNDLASRLENMKIEVDGSNAARQIGAMVNSGRPKVNADTGRSMPPETIRPPGWRGGPR